MSTAITFDMRALGEVSRRFSVQRLGDKRTLMDAIGFAVENQTRDRIANDKRSPQGKPWAPWSPAYAGTRNAGQSLLQSEGDLLDTLTYAVDIDGEAVEIGSNEPYAAIQQFGGKSGMPPGPAAIPPRPYLGLSNENESDIADLVTHWLDARVLGDARA